MRPHATGDLLIGEAAQACTDIAHDEKAARDEQAGQHAGEEQRADRAFDASE